MERLLEMMKEPSSYGGIAILLGIVLPHAGIDAGTLQTIGAGVAAVLTIVMKETGTKPVSQLPAPPPLLDQAKTSCHAWLPLLLIGGLLLGGCATNSDGSKTINAPSVATIANDVGLVTGGLQRSLTAAAATPGLDISADTMSQALAALSGLKGVAQAIAGASDPAAAQPLVVQVEGYVNAFVGAMASIPQLPPKVQAYLTAATVLLPVIEVAVNMVVPQPTPPGAADTARSTLAGPS